MSRNFRDFCDGCCNFGETSVMHYYAADGTPVKVLTLDMRFFGVPPEFTKLVWWPWEAATRSSKPDEVMSEDEFRERGFQLNVVHPEHQVFTCTFCNSWMAP